MIGLRLSLIKNETLGKVFSSEFAKCFRTAFSQNTSAGALLRFISCNSEVQKYIALIQYKVFKGNETETFCLKLAFELVFANFIFLHKTCIPILSIIFIHFQENICRLR